MSPLYPPLRRRAIAIFCVVPLMVLKWVNLPKSCLKNINCYLSSL
nr:MAG TPA: hypothetical protein [Caudoviricetes sp.]